ncbi:MAG TPA: TMEM175 family protein [Solirubrobacterales bacterium]
MRYSREESEFDRAFAFLDATFALALTLLVTTLDVNGSGSVWKSLGSLEDEIGSQFIAFAIAFAVIANYWLLHHRMVSSFAEIDQPMIVANLWLIAAIVLLPFSTEAVGDPAINDLALPTALFAVNVAAASILSTGIYWLAWKRNLFRSRPSPAELRQYLIAGLVPAVVFLGSIPIAYLASPLAAKLFWLSLLVLKPLTGRRRAPEAEAG